MKIGNLNITGKVFLAPMAGVTDRAYRQIVKQFGCALIFTEMVSAKAIIYGNEKTMDLLAIDAVERPIGVQVFGSDPDIMARAASIIYKQVYPELIDINMGCPVPKVVNNGEGSALMKNIERAAMIVKAINNAVGCPVTVKMRKGFDDGSINAVELAQAVEDAGAAMVTVHGRTREQYYSGEADWDIIKLVKECVSIPVVGNGDIFEPQDALEMIKQTGCDAVMVARGARGNPWLCNRAETLLRIGKEPGEPSITERFEIMKRHLDLEIEYKGENVAVREMRTHLSYYTKGMPHAAEMRKRIYEAETRDEVFNLLDEYYQTLV